MITLHEQATALLEDYELELEKHPKLQKLCSLLSRPKNFSISKDMYFLLDRLLSDMDCFLSLSEGEREESWEEVEGVADAGVQALELYSKHVDPHRYTIN